MRMALCWPGLILLLYALPIYASAANYTLTTELTNFIPSCARTCFESFLDENFPTSICSTTPALECLCSHNTTSGYTIGEGAVQCIISEDNISFCQGNDAKEDVAISAFNMCVGQANALPNTHGTITATLIVETSMPSIVLIAPASTTKSILVSSSSSITQTNSASFSSLVTVTGSPSTSSPTSSITPVQSASEAAAATTTLTKPQIIGITVASLGAGCVGIAALLIFICLRRRRQRKARESDMLPFQLDPPSHLMDKRKYKYKSFKGPTGGKPGGTRNGLAAKIAPPIPPRIDTSNPNMFSRRSVRPDTIGLAISPESNVAIEKKQRRSSKLLPEKPNLTLKMPQQTPGGLSFSQPVPGIVRQSTATHFEEDEFDSADTAVNADDSWGRKSTEKILDNGAGSWPTFRFVEPDAPKPVVFVDGGREYHWRPPQASSNISASPDLSVKPLNLSRRQGSFSQPRRPDEYSRPQEQSLKLTIPHQAARPITTSSSVYSARGSLPGSDVTRQSAPRSRKSYRQSGPYDTRQSAGSLTSFDSLDSRFSPDGTEPRTAGMDLSPVVESPRSPTSPGGKSPVTYPKIPGILSASAIRMVPPPPQPDFTRAMGGARAAPAGKPWRQAELTAQRERDRITRQSQEQTQAAARELQTQVGMQSLNLGHRRQRSSESKNIYNFPAPPATVRSQPAPPVQSQTRDQAPVDATGGFGHGSRVNQLSTQPNITVTRSSSQMSQYSQASKTSTSSSLLAKRLGEQKAAAFILKGEEEKNRKWRVLKRDEIEMAKKSGWRPTLSSGGQKASPRSRGDGGASSAGRGEEQRQLETPTTPGWVGLTPTRRGDELFLSVQ